MNFRTRAWNSKEGVIVAAIIYFVLLIIAWLKGYVYDTMPGWFQKVLVPAASWIHSPSNTMILGISINLVVASLAVYMVIGYLVDWYYEPGK
jgi:hypothetical protein